MVKKCDGRSKTKLYKSWLYMKRRCDNPDEHHKKYYKDIKIIEEWYNFDYFKLWAKDDNVKIGFSYINIESRYDDKFGFEDENGTFEEFVIGTYDEYFKKFPDLKFCFTVDKALDGNFINWEEFCSRVDNNEGFSDILWI